MVIRKLNTIESAATRRALQKRLVERIEEEALLCQMIGTDAGGMDPEKMHAEAIKLVQSQSEDEILEALEAPCHLLLSICCRT